MGTSKAPHNVVQNHGLLSERMPKSVCIQFIFYEGKPEINWYYYCCCYISCRKTVNQVKHLSAEGSTRVGKGRSGKRGSKGKGPAPKKLKKSPEQECKSSLSKVHCNWYRVLENKRGFVCLYLFLYIYIICCILLSHKMYMFFRDYISVNLIDSRLLYSIII